MDALMTTREVADRLRLSPNTIKKLWRQGKLKGHRLSERKLRFRPADVEAFLAASAGAAAVTRHPYRAEELDWRQRNREVLESLVGEWVVVEGSQLVAHSPDPREALARARSLGVAVPYIFYVEPREPGTVLMGL